MTKLFKRIRGYSLTEAVISMLLFGIGVAAVSSGFLTMHQLQNTSTRKQLANVHADQLRTTLKLFNVAYKTGAEPQEIDLAALDAAMLGLNGCASECRKLPGDPCPWAFAPGCAHDASRLLPAWFSGAPYNARMTYTVAPDSGGRGVSVSVAWTEPKS